ncbi:MAG: ABC transporter permease, partial [Pseudomonadota bacterium]
MEPLTWTGSLSGLNYIFYLAVALLAISIIAGIVMSLVPQSGARAVSADGTLAADKGVTGLINMATGYLFLAVVALILIYLIAGIFMGTSAGIFGGMSQQFTPVWIALIVTFAVSITYKRKLGLYGKLFDSTVGMIGFGIVMFWVFTGVFGGVFDLLVTHDSLSQTS